MRKSEFATLLLTAAFLLMAWSGSWFEIVAEGTYTEGLDREPTIRTQYMVDSSQESFEMSIENSTPLLLYWLEREDISPAPTNQNENSSESSADTPSLDGDSEPCSGSCLDRARSWVGLTMFALFATLYLSSVRPSTLTRATVVLVWLLGTVVILTAVPLAAAADFGISGDEDSGGESSTGGFDTSTQETVEVDQFAHFEQDGDMGLSFDGISFTYDSVGFDLGLLAEEDRQAVIDSAPAEGEPGYESLIAFHGELSIGPGEILTWWLFTAPLIIVSLRGHRELLEEE